MQSSPSTTDEAAYAQMERLVVDMGRLYRERNEALAEVTQAHHEALFRLALAADYRDDDTGTHIVRLGFLAEELALLSGEPAGWAQMLRKAAPMHDVGKIGIPDEVLKKPGAFTPDERAVMNQHTRIGAEILGSSRIPLFRLAAEVAMAHHERWDGRGYPDGRSKQDIPLSGRIVAVVDFFDALTMDRCYRPAFPDERALQMLVAERGGAFEPRLVDTFVANFHRFVALREAVNTSRPNFRELAEGHALTLTLGHDTPAPAGPTAAAPEPSATLIPVPRPNPIREARP